MQQFGRSRSEADINHRAPHLRLTTLLFVPVPSTRSEISRATAAVIRLSSSA